MEKKENKEFEQNYEISKVQKFGNFENLLKFVLQMKFKKEIIVS